MTNSFSMLEHQHRFRKYIQAQSDIFRTGLLVIRPCHWFDYFSASLWVRKKNYTSKLLVSIRHWAWEVRHCNWHGYWDIVYIVAMRAAKNYSESFNVSQGPIWFWKSCLICASIILNRLSSHYQSQTPTHRTSNILCHFLGFCLPKWGTVCARGTSIESKTMMSMLQVHLSLEDYPTVCIHVTMRCPSAYWDFKKQFTDATISAPIVGNQRLCRVSS